MPLSRLASGLGGDGAFVEVHTSSAVVAGVVVLGYWVDPLDPHFRSLITQQALVLDYYFLLVHRGLLFLLDCVQVCDVLTEVADV